MTANDIGQLIYANLIEQDVYVGSFQGEPLGTHSATEIDGCIDLEDIGAAILKAQNDEAAMSRVGDPVDLPDFDAAVEKEGIL
jgi:hypothetical protein